MIFLLRLKHWQLFLLTWGVPIVVDIFTFSQPELLFKLFPFMMVAFSIGTFGWIWAIATGLHPKLPEGINLNLSRFKILFSIPMIYIVIIIGSIAYSMNVLPEGGGSGAVVILVMLHLVSMVCIFLGMRFAAKTMKSVELGRLAHFSDYAGEFFMIWFSIIGFWVLQPRLNKLAE